MSLHLQNQDRQKDPLQKEKIDAKCMVGERGFKADYFPCFCGANFSFPLQRTDIFSSIS
jgi:hypothetical protein